MQLLIDRRYIFFVEDEHFISSLRLRICITKNKMISSLSKHSPLLCVKAVLIPITINCYIHKCSNAVMIVMWILVHLLSFILGYDSA